MKSRQEETNIQGEVEKVRIPNEGIVEWMQTLREGGFTDREIDQILIDLNPEYAEQKMSPEDRNFFRQLLATFEQRGGRKVTTREKEAILRAVVSRRETQR